MTDITKRVPRAIRRKLPAAFKSPLFLKDKNGRSLTFDELGPDLHNLLTSTGLEMTATAMSCSVEEFCQMYHMWEIVHCANGRIAVSLWARWDAYEQGNGRGFIAGIGQTLKDYDQTEAGQFDLKLFIANDVLGRHQFYEQYPWLDNRPRTGQADVRDGTGTTTFENDNAAVETLLAEGFDFPDFSTAFDFDKGDPEKTLRDIRTGANEKGRTGGPSPQVIDGRAGGGPVLIAP